MISTKERFSISIDEDSIKAISSISAQTGLTKSFLVGRWISEGLKRSNDLSVSERYFFSKKIIQECIDSLFLAIGYESRTKDIRNSVLILYTIPSSCFQSEKEYSLFRLSIFGLLDKIQIHDNKLHQNIIDSLKELNLKVSKNSEISEGYKPSDERNEHGESKGSLEGEHPAIDSEGLKSSEISLFPAGVTGII